MIRPFSRRCLAVAAVICLGSLSLVLLGAGDAGAGEEFSRGDANVDGKMSLSDSLMIRRWLFNGDRPPVCLDAADANDDGQVDLSDQIRIILALFFDGPSLPAPYLEVGPDPTEDELLCASYDIVEPEEDQGLVRLGDVVGVPGQEVEVPVFVTSPEDVEAFQLVVSYNPDLFTPRSREQGLSFEGTFYEEVDLGLSFQGVFPFEDQGVFLVGFVPSLLWIGLELPAGEETLAFKIVGTIPQGAPESVDSLMPLNNGFGPAGMRNELTHRGEARFVSTIPNVEKGRLEIVGDQTVFIRGDSNGDSVIDLSDARHTLGYLFLGTEAPVCLDAADSDDDGNLNITDPVRTLVFLFRGGPFLPAPYPNAGIDPTPDTMECASTAN